MKRISLFGVLAVSATTASAQSIKPHPLGGVSATSKEILGSVTLARHLPNGSVIVNDQARRRLLLVDQTLQNVTVIADSMPGSVNSYGQRPGALIPYLADSTLYLDATAGSFLVIDPSGKVTRVMSTPRPNDNSFLASTALGYPGFDTKGRLVYRVRPIPQMMQTRDGGIQQGAALDSAPLIRVDLDTRKADTVGRLKLGRNISSTITMPNGGTANMSTQAPLPLVDDWTLLSDGSIAFLRGQDYHIDWILPDGSKKSTDRVPYDWKRLTDDEKLVLADSLAKAQAEQRTQMMQGGGGPVMSFGDGGGATRMIMGGGDVMMGGGGRGGPVVSAAPPAASATSAPPAASGSSRTTAGADGRAATAVSPAGAPAGAAAAGSPTGFVMPTMPTAVASDFPDYRPVFQAGAARPDADANLWVRTSMPGSAPASLVYDVINNKGQLTDRVEVPGNMSIVGFGKGGIVYLTQRDAAGVRLVRATVR